MLNCSKEQLTIDILVKLVEQQDSLYYNEKWEWLWSQKCYRSSVCKLKSSGLLFMVYAFVPTRTRTTM